VTHSEYETSFVEVGGVRLRLAVAGSGPPVMFLFGSGRAGTIDKAKPLTDQFTDHFTVACPDQRGLGLSDIPPGPWTMADYADDAFGIADHLGWEKFSVMGLSFGGMVGLEMAATQPQRIDRMVLWGTSPGGSAHSYPLHILKDAPPAEQHAKFAELMDTRLSGQWKSKPSREALFVQAVLERGGSPWVVAPGEDESRNVGFGLQLDARRDHDVTSRLGQIQAATFIGAGFYDGLAPVANAEIMHAGITGSVLRVYEAGHFFYLDNRKAFSDAHKFLSGDEVTRMPVV
jgi:3-oxoadipate enol-lactonase